MKNGDDGELITNIFRRNKTSLNIRKVNYIIFYVIDFSERYHYKNRRVDSRRCPTQSSVEF